MKKLIAVLMVTLGLSAVRPMHAQLFTPESFSGAALGALTGALVGGCHAVEAAAIGAGSGFLFGTLIHEARRDPYTYYGPYATGYYPPFYDPYYSRHSIYPAPPPAPAYHADPKSAANQTPAVTQAQTAPADPPPVTTLKAQSPPSVMTSANNLFGR
jgi:hypothetical protein